MDGMEPSILSHFSRLPQDDEARFLQHREGRGYSGQKQTTMNDVCTMMTYA